MTLEEKKDRAERATESELSARKRARIFYALGAFIIAALIGIGAMSYTSQQATLDNTERALAQADSNAKRIQEIQQAASTQAQNADTAKRDLANTVANACASNPAIDANSPTCQAAAKALASPVTTANTEGATGPQGPQGLAGRTGNKGDKGDKGDQGERGPAGPTGPPGLPGAQGEVGPPGTNGADGSPGADGAPGLQGEAGAQGPQGEMGPEGPIGPQGEMGPPGPVIISAHCEGEAFTITLSDGTTLPVAGATACLPAQPEPVDTPNPEPT